MVIPVLGYSLSLYGYSLSRIAYPNISLFGWAEIWPSLCFCTCSLLTAPPLQQGYLLHIWHFRTTIVALFYNLFTSPHSWNHLVSLPPDPSTLPTPSAVLTQPCIPLAHLQ